MRQARRRRTCVCERKGYAAVWAPQGEEPRSCRDNQFLWWGGTLCERNHLGPRPGADREGLSGPTASAPQQRPPLRRLQGRDPARLRVGRSLTWFLGLPTREAGLWCQGEQWTPPGGPSLPWAPGAAFQKLILSLLLFQKLPRFFLLFFPQGYCTVSLSAFLWGVIIALSMRSWVTSPRVKEKLDDGGGKERKQTLPPVGTGR